MEYRDLTEAGCTLVYGGSEKERADFEKEFLAAYPEFETGIHPEFANDKKGLFGKSLSAWKILLKHPALKARGPKQVEEMTKNLFLHDLINRAPITMANTQKFRFSLFLTALEGKKCFFLKDKDERNTDDTLNTILWIRENVKNAKIVWLTDAACDSELTKTRKGIAIPFFFKYKPSILSVSDRVIDLSEQTK